MGKARIKAHGNFWRVKRVWALLFWCVVTRDFVRLGVFGFDRTNLEPNGVKERVIGA